MACAASDVPAIAPRTLPTPHAFWRRSEELRVKLPIDRSINFPWSIYMTTLTSIALSGMQAASTRLDVSAHNVANVQTPNFHRQVVHQQSVQSQETAGVVTTVGKAAEVGADLAADMVEQMSASYSYKANLHTIQTQEQMTGSLLDLKA